MPYEGGVGIWFFVLSRKGIVNKHVSFRAKSAQNLGGTCHVKEHTGLELD